MEHLTEEQIFDLIVSAGQKEWIGHMSSCELCRLKYEHALSVHNGLTEFQYHRPSMRFAKNIVELIKQQQQLDRTSLLWTRIIGGTVLMAISLTIMMIVYWLIPAFEVKENTQNIIRQWSVLFLVVSGCFWLLYFFDRWLGKRIYRHVSSYGKGNM